MACATPRYCRRFSGLRITLQALQVRADIGRVLVPEVAILFQTLADDALQFGWHIGIQPHWGNRGAIQDGSKITPVLSPRNGNVPVAIS
jgi:hypothetical protein